MVGGLLDRLGSLALGILATAGFAATAAAATLTVAVNSAPASSEFATKHDDVTAAVLHHVVEGLVAYDESMRVAPMLADGWTVSDGGRVYTFRLRAGLRFHNGQPVTAADVKWNWDRFRDPAREWGSHCREWYDGSAEGYHRPVRILAVDVVDPLTVAFRLQGPSELFLHLMASNHCISGIVHRDSVAADGSWRGPIGTGPFAVASWPKDGVVELRRFADYAARPEPRSGFAGGKQAIPRTVRFVPYADAAAARADVEAGKVDVWFRAPFDVARDSAASGRATMVFQQTPAFHQLILQTRTEPLLADVRMRRAIAMAIDPAAITAEVTAGLGKANPSAVARSLPAHTAAHERGHPFDPAAARELARQAGYRGEPLRIQASRAPYPSFHAAAVVAARQLQAAGFNASVEELDWRTHDVNYGENKYQLTSITFSLRTDPALMYSAIVGQKSDHSWYTWEDPQVANLVASSVFLPEGPDRQRLFDQIHAQMLEWVPLVGLFNHFVTDLTAPGLQGYASWPMALPRLWGVTPRGVGKQS